MARVYPTSYAYIVSLEGGGWAMEFRRLAYPGSTETVGEPERRPMRSIDTASPEMWEKIGNLKADSDQGWALVENSIAVVWEGGRVTHYLELPRGQDRG